MTTIAKAESRGRAWLRRLARQEGAACFGLASVIQADALLDEEMARFIAVVPNPDNRFPRARNGEVGLEEGWTLAKVVRETMAVDAVSKAGLRRPIVAIVDVVSQAYGRQEEMLGIHLACAAAAAAYAEARLAGHPVIALLVGKAMSGAFLAHGYQANRIVALDDPGVLVHAMSKSAAARVTRRSVAELDELGEKIPPLSYSIKQFASLGLVHHLLKGIDADNPDASGVEQVCAALTAAVADTRASGQRGLSCRLESVQARTTRSASIEVRRRLAEQWEA